MHNPEIAIIDNNTLSGVGLKSVIEQLLPMAAVRTFNSFAELTADTPDAYFHYFVSASIVLEHQAFFKERQHKTIVLQNGATTGSLLDNGFRTLDTSLPINELIKQILKLHQTGHAHHPHGNNSLANEEERRMGASLSPREIDVLQLVVKGFINKEIADKLHISLPTVITHRKNIVEKLGIRSVGGLTIYAVLNGFVEADDI